MKHQDKLNELNSQIQDLIKQSCAIDEKLRDLKQKYRNLDIENRKERVKKVFHEGGYYALVNPNYGYHDDIVVVYQLFVRSDNGFKGKIYRVAHCDGEYYTSIQDYKLDDHKLDVLTDKVFEITEEQFNKDFLPLVLDPREKTVNEWLRVRADEESEEDFQFGHTR